MKMLNIACGNRYHEDWVNIDFHPESKIVKKVNILKGLPFENESFDVIYCGHFLEHLSKDQAEFILKEAKRVLKSGGILRVVVPDLENICREYLHVLDLVLVDKNYDNKYEWITIELLDQMARTRSGGEMGKFFKKTKMANDVELANYILQRTGDEILTTNEKTTKSNKKVTMDKIINKFIYLYLKLIRKLIPKRLRDQVFINTTIGERHCWMYDRYSMKKIIEKIGFKNITLHSYDSSSIPDFNKYLLDIKANGTPYKGVSSLYIEATK